jgi:hypothetical protein
MFIQIFKRFGELSFVVQLREDQALLFEPLGLGNQLDIDNLRPARR